MADERDLLRVLLTAKTGADSKAKGLTIPDAPKLTLAILQSAQSEVLRQPLESRAVRRSYRLEWDALIELFGSEAVLRERLAELKDAQPEGAGELLELADKYSSGWRPDDFWD